MLKVRKIKKMMEQAREKEEKHTREREVRGRRFKGGAWPDMWGREKRENMRKCMRSNKKAVEGKTHQAAKGLKAKHDRKEGKGR